MLNEQAIIDYIAGQERAIIGIKASFDYAKNPDSLTQFPCVVHFIGSFQMKPLAHHNVWDESLKLTSVVFVRPRQTMGGKLAYLENEAIPFGYKWRQKFQDHTVLTNALAGMGARRAWLESGNYGSGGALLEYASVSYLGWIMIFNIASA
jgi:hypothetical protein